MAGKNSKTIQTQLRPSPQIATTPSSGSSVASEVEGASAYANLNIAALKLELLASVRKNIADIFKKELQDTLGDALPTTKLD